VVLGAAGSVAVGPPIVVGPVEVFDAAVDALLEAASAVVFGMAAAAVEVPLVSDEPELAELRELIS